MVIHDRQPSLEQLSPQRRSFTAAALRKGHIKISEPVPLENSGPSPVWNPSPTWPKSPSSPSASRSLHSDSKTNLPAHVRPNTAPIGNQSHFLKHHHQLTLPLADPVDNMPQDDSILPDTYKFPSPPDTQVDAQNASLRHKRSSLLTRDGPDASVTQPSESGSGGLPSGTRTSMIEHSETSAMSTPTKKQKRRSGSIRGAFKRMFSKREKPTQERPVTTRGPRHEYHASVCPSIITWTFV